MPFESVVFDWGLIRFLTGGKKNKREPDRLCSSSEWSIVCIVVETNDVTFEKFQDVFAEPLANV